MLSVDFQDVSADAPKDVHFPDVVQGFEALGHVRLGRLRRVVRPGGRDRVARAYPEEHRPVLLARSDVPPVVLAAPDASAFAMVDWWWGMPEVRLRTALTTGHVVETRRAWDWAPVWPRALAPAARHLCPAGEQRRSQARGRGVRLAAGDPAALWQAHLDHVEHYRRVHGGAPVPHRDLEQAAALSRRLAVHDLRTETRRAQLNLALVLTWVALVSLLLVLTAAAGGGVLLLVPAVVIGVMVLALRRLTARLRYWAVVRPPFA